MSSIIPVPPLPPPPAINCLTPIGCKATKALSACLWAIEEPELQKACYLARVCETHAPHACSYQKVDSILQEGPTCGLTALSMILNGSPTPQELLEMARKRRYTNNGEMFSASNLFNLICEHIVTLTTAAALLAKEFECQIGERRVSHVECEMHEGPLNCAKVRERLLAGACIFVPYDPDYNHSPCLKLGHKAHWALIIGYLITDKDEFYVLARHGKAKNLAVWLLTALSDSNANLIEFAQPKGYPDCKFLLPAGGIGGDLGLRERAIIVSGQLPHKTITIR